MIVKDIYPKAVEHGFSDVFTIYGSGFKTPIKPIAISLNGMNYYAVVDSDTSARFQIPYQPIGYTTLRITNTINFQDVVFITYNTTEEPSLINGNADTSSKADIGLLYDSAGEDGFYGNTLHIEHSPTTKYYKVDGEILVNTPKFGLPLQYNVGDLVYCKNQTLTSDNGLWEIHEDAWVFIAVVDSQTILDFGATAIDAIDGDITNKILTVLTIDPTVAGFGDITYYVLNTSGVLTTAVRKIVVDTVSNMINNGNTIISDLEIKNEIIEDLANQQQINKLISSYETQVETINTEINTEVPTFKWEGEWQAIQYYYFNDVVRYNGDLYICKRKCKGIDPLNTNYWDLFLEKGIDGSAINPRGEYDSATVYHPMDVVYVGSKLYLCQVQSVNESPETSSKWTLFIDNTITDTLIIDALGYVPYDAQNPSDFLVKNDIITEFTFASSNQWNITHNLISPAPNVVVITSGGKVVETDVQYPTPNTIIINFANPTSGKAYLS